MASKLKDITFGTEMLTAEEIESGYVAKDSSSVSDISKVDVGNFSNEELATLLNKLATVVCKMNGIELTS